MTQRRIYQDEFPYFVTFCTREGWRLFADDNMAGLLSGVMFNAAELKRYDILAYQIMPDHVHLLAHASCVGERGRRHPRSVGERPSSPPPIAGLCARDGNATHHPTISDFMCTVKSFFIKQIRARYGIPCSIWHTRFYARTTPASRCEARRAGRLHPEIPGEHYSIHRAQPDQGGIAQDIPKTAVPIF